MTDAHDLAAQLRARITWHVAGCADLAALERLASLAAHADPTPYPGAHAPLPPIERAERNP